MYYAKIPVDLSISKMVAYMRNYDDVKAREICHRMKSLTSVGFVSCFLEEVKSLVYGRQVVDHIARSCRVLGVDKVQECLSVLRSGQSEALTVTRGLGTGTQVQPLCAMELDDCDLEK